MGRPSRSDRVAQDGRHDRRRFGHGGRSRAWDLVSVVGWPELFVGAREDALTYVVLPWLLPPLLVAPFVLAAGEEPSSVPVRD
jgi:hypothetical protein